MQKYFFFLILSVFIVRFEVFSKDFKITGRILDSLTAQPLENATIILETEQSFKKYNQISDNNGQFSFSRLQKGNYTIFVKFLGYTSKSFNVQIIDENIEITSILLSLEDISLNEIVIKASRPLIVQQKGIINYNIAGSIWENQGNAIDLLKKIPFLSIDNSINVRLKGKKVTFFLDGKEILLTGDALENFLLSLTSQSIDNFELVFTPGSKYDSSIMSIVNIKTVKAKQLGNTGTLTAGLGFGKYFRYNTGLQVSKKAEKYTIFGGFSQQQLKRYFITKNERDIQTNNQFNKVYFNDLENDIRAVKLLNLKFGGEFTPNKFNSINFLFQADINNRERNVNYLSKIGTLDKIDSTLMINSTGKANFNNYSGGLNYIKKFKNNSNEINFNIDLGRYYINWGENIKVKNPEAILAKSTPWVRTIDFSSIDGNYSIPLKKGKLELGGQFKNSSVNTEFKYFNSLVLDSAKSSLYIYKENIKAGYFNFENSTNKLNYQLGLRYEHTSVSGDEKLNNDLITSQYSRLYPSISLQYILNDISQITFSAANKITRPSFEWMNRRILFKSPYFFTRGGGLISPSYSNSFDLGYVLNNNISFNFGHLSRKKGIGFVPIISENNTIYQVKNINSFKYTYFDAAFNKQINSVWNNSINLEAYHTNVLIDNLSKNKLGNTITINIQNSIKMKKIGTMDFAINYFSKDYSDVYNSLPQYYVDFGFSRKFFKNSIDLKFTITDVFNTYISRYGYSGDSINLNESFKVESRFFRLNFLYRFGNKNASFKEKASKTGNDLKRILL
jgi:Outer membrane protein beta-barrel family/CarboxypepD_reg-like domain